jgi:hypothetical protein
MHFDIYDIINYLNESYDDRNTQKNNLFCHYFEIHFDNKSCQYNHPETQLLEPLIQENIFDSLLDIFDSLLKTNEGRFDEMDNFYYNSIKVNKDNIMEMFFNMTENDKYSNKKNYYEISNYFEWMKLDEQIKFWNIINDEHGDYDVYYTMMFSQSELFINHAFDQLKIDATFCCDAFGKDQCDQCDNSNLGIFKYWKVFIDRFPETKGTILVELIIESFTKCIYLLNLLDNVYPQDMTKIIKEELAKK